MICSILPTPLQIAPSLDYLQNPSSGALFPDGPWLLGASKRDQMVQYKALAVQGGKQGGAWPPGRKQRDGEGGAMS